VLLDGGTWVGLNAGMRERRPSRAIVDLAALRANFAEARRAAAGRDVISVIKADAYGHGSVPVGRALVEAGCGRLAVLTVAEASVLREGGIEVPVLMLSGVHDAEEAQAALELGLTCTVHHAGQVALLRDAAAAVGAEAPVHVEVDTGMRRMGVPPEDAAALLQEVVDAPRLSLQGVFTHLACADDPDLSDSLGQLARFREVLAALRARGGEPELVHVANSAGLVAGKPIAEAVPDANAVRPGIMLYGPRPAPHFDVPLRPVMTLETRVVRVRNVRAGESVGYSAEFRAQRDTRVATLALGYADGVPIAMSGRGSVMIRGERFPIAGRVSMDYIGVDVGSASVEIGDAVVVFGDGKAGRLLVEDAASVAGTISYELLVRVGARVPREYV